jgi:hypothetical protein
VVVKSIGGVHEGCNVRICHVYKEPNRVADALVSIGCQLVDFSLFDDPPNNIDKLCFFNFLGVSISRIISV